MGKRTALLAGAAAAAVLLGGAAVAAVAATQLSRDAQVLKANPVVALPANLGWVDDDIIGPPLSAEESDKAASAALAQVGQGRVSEIERENERGAAYEVEVRLDNGMDVEVLLGADFQVLHQSGPEYDDD